MTNDSMQQIIQGVLETRFDKWYSQELATDIAQALRKAGYSQNEDTRILDWIEKQGDIFSIVVDPDLDSLRINYSKWQSNVKSLRDAILSVMREAGFEKGEG